MEVGRNQARPVHRAGPTAVAVESLTKRFGTVTALDRVSLEFKAGQVHALLGANGSGKSTLVKILSGAQRPTSGDIIIGDRRLPAIETPVVAAGVGIRVVYQEAPLIDTLSVLESVAVFRGYQSKGLGRVPWRKLRRETSELLERAGVQVDVGKLCSQISAADRASVSLAVALGQQSAGAANAGDPDAGNAGLLIIDEATASIPDSASDIYLQRIRKVADDGLAVLIVTHRLAELSIADDVTMLRGGAIVFREAGGPRPSTEELIDLLTGEDLSHQRQADDAGAGAARGRPATTATAVAATGPRPVATLWGDQNGARPFDEAAEAIRFDRVTAGDLNGFDFVGRPGEVVGFVGGVSEGIRDLPRLLAGQRSLRAGSVTVAGRKLRRTMTPAQLIGAGVAVVPSDRLHDGGVAGLSVEANITLPDLERYWHHPARSKDTVQRVIRALDVRPPKAGVLFGSLSGGNQQKVLLGKWLTMRPAVLVVDDPTYGVDPGARQTIFAAIRDAAALGVCVLFLSTEPELMLQACTRIAVIRDGVVSENLSEAELTPTSIAEWSY
ncbi:MAG TPA: ATP-binding cassette domain-containing protein [Trebonia sp.]|jgi:ABC-type sugar transport system ATPase subunit|nr:ATP-binding cassette domain-containing protein [Trebonia sp.]